MHLNVVESGLIGPCHTSFLDKVSRSQCEKLHEKLRARLQEDVLECLRALSSGEKLIEDLKDMNKRMQDAMTLVQAIDPEEVVAGQAPRLLACLQEALDSGLSVNESSIKSLAAERQFDAVLSDNNLEISPLQNRVEFSFTLDQKIFGGCQRLPATGYQVCCVYARVCARVCICVCTVWVNVFRVI